MEITNPKREAVSREEVIAWLKGANWDGKVMPIIQATLDLLARGEALQAPITEEVENIASWLKESADDIASKGGGLSVAFLLNAEHTIRSQAQEIAGLKKILGKVQDENATCRKMTVPTLKAENATLRKQLEGGADAK
jgi:hypothetical protein